MRNIYNQKLLPKAVVQDQVLHESFLIELKWVNFHVDPILRISRILNFPQNEIHAKYQKNFPFVKLKPCELSLKLLSVEFNQRKKSWKKSETVMQ